MHAPRIATPLVLLLLAACGNGSQETTGMQQSRQLAVGVSAAAPVAADYHRVVQQIYVGYFGRPADVGGLDWHAKVLLAAGAPTDIGGIAGVYDSNAALRAEIDSFGTSAESAALYPGDNGQFIDALYRNLFGRAADAGGKAFWVNALDKNLMTRASAAIQLMAGAGGADVGIIANKTSVASSFTAQIVTPVLAQGYTGLASDAVVRTMLGQVGGNTDLAAFNATIRATLTGLAGSVARSNGWDIQPQAPAIGSATVKAPVILSTQVVARPPALPAAPPVPAILAAAPAGANLKLWLYDPRSSTGAALATGIFLRNVTANGGWAYVGANADGSLYQQLAAGVSYEFDAVEPNGSNLQRRRYQVTVAASGAASVQDQNANANGYYAVTLTVPAVVTAEVKLRQDALRLLAERPASSFRPTSQCQLLDQVSPQRSFATDLSAGFPKVRTRLPSFGQLRSLIIPVDFPEVAGTDDPGAFFKPFANEVRDFYQKQSYGRLAFEFDILPNWVRLPFNPSKYGFTSVNGSGDFASYRNDIFAMLDGQVDFSKYDAVYILVPKQMPMAKMGYGPAITGPTWTSSGYVINGATGGADMYLAPGNEWRWMAHETGHAFGLYDEDLDHKTQTLGHWSIMAMNWSRNAIENVSWDRYLMGWLPEEQVACLPKDSLTGAGTTVALGPLVRQSADTKAAMVPLSSSKILVMESRKNEGYDRIAAGNEGVLVYTVDMTLGTLKGGYRTVRRQGSVDPNFEDAALRTGESVTVEGVTVTVTASSKDGDTVKLSRQ
ncbi:MAG: DUF4214 domain-containing protein [Telluria sp.]